MVPKILKNSLGVTSQTAPVNFLNVPTCNLAPSVVKLCAQLPLNLPDSGPILNSGLYQRDDMKNHYIVYSDMGGELKLLLPVGKSNLPGRVEPSGWPRNFKKEVMSHKTI